MKSQLFLTVILKSTVELTKISLLFINSLTTVEKVEILPYHTMGKYKWEDLGLKYELEGVPSATDEDVARAKEILGCQ